MKVCVIGGGMGGLVTARFLVNDVNRFEVTVFERNTEIGGTWIYTNRNNLDGGPPVYSSMYKNLRINGPGHLMHFPDFNGLENDEYPFRSHEEVLQYLQNFADFYGLKKYIQLNTTVLNVSIDRKDINITKFDVLVKNVSSNQTKIHVCDSVIVCNGHNSKPHIPIIKGIETFTGKVMHSHDYRKPENFANKKIVVLGASASGVDISYELSRYASRVYLSHNKKRLAEKSPQNVLEMTGISSVRNRTVHFKDGFSVTADVLMFCTGYEYDFSFLDENIGITFRDKFIFPLYKHMLHVNYTNLAFIGMTWKDFPSATIYTQAKFYAQVLKKNARLPSKDEMYRDAMLKTPQDRYAHALGLKQVSYLRELTMLGRSEPLPSYYLNGIVKYTLYFMEHPWTHKEAKFKLSENGTDVLIYPKKMPKLNVSINKET